MNRNISNLPFFRLSAIAATGMLIMGCGSKPLNNAQHHLPESDPQPVQRMQEVLAAESKRLLTQQMEIQSQLRQLAAAKKTEEPKPPVFDPLEGKNVSIAISNASISQILAVFSDAAKVNLIVEPAVVQLGSQTDMYLRDISLRDAFNEVLKSYDVTGEIRNQTLRVSLNEEKFFSLSFLNVTSQMAASSGGNVFGANSGAGSSAISGNLSINSSSVIRADPFTELESNLRLILGESKPPLDNAQQANAARPGQPVAPVATVQSNQQQTFTLNRTTGTLFVKARPSQMRSVENLIKRAQDMLTKQVYIEAQLIDVQLNDGYQLGIDWEALRNNVAFGFGANAGSLAGTTSALGARALSPASLTIPAKLLTPDGQGASGFIGHQDRSGFAILNALRTFGTLKVLSNPNIQVRNNTPAMLSVGTSQRYVARSSSSQANPGGGATTTTSDVQTDSVFSGVMVGVLPLMREDGRIELMINPVQSEVDPQSLALVAVNSSNSVTLPQVAYKSLSTTLNVGDGDVVVVGGLIDQKISNSNRGLPGLSDIPFFGKLGSKEASSQINRELIVVLRVRVL